MPSRVSWFRRERSGDYASVHTMLGEWVYVDSIENPFCCSAQNFIFSPFHLLLSLFLFFLVILCRPFWDTSRVLCGMEVDLTSFYCNLLARFSLDGYLCNCVDWIGRRNRSASSASNAVKIPRDCNLDRHKRCALFMNWMNEIANCFWHLYCFSVNGKRRIVSVFCKLLWHWVVFSGKIFLIHNCYILAGNVIASD